MNALFAPWRMEFIEKGDGGKICVFCEMIKSKDFEKHQIIAQGKLTFVVMNKYPYAHGHILIIPHRHEADWTKLSSDEISEMGLMSQKSLKALSVACQPQGFNMGVNIGKPAGAGIEGHVHQHVVPRWSGDVNFMPLLAETKVISEHLVVTYQKIKKAWESLS